MPREIASSWIACLHTVLWKPVLSTLAITFLLNHNNFLGHHQVTCSESLTPGATVRALKAETLKLTQNRADPWSVWVISGWPHEPEGSSREFQGWKTWWQTAEQLLNDVYALITAAAGYLTLHGKGAWEMEVRSGGAACCVWPRKAQCKGVFKG